MIFRNVALAILVIFVGFRGYVVLNGNTSDTENGDLARVQVKDLPYMKKVLSLLSKDIKEVIGEQPLALSPDYEFAFFSLETGLIHVDSDLFISGNEELVAFALVHEYFHKLNSTYLWGWVLLVYGFVFAPLLCFHGTAPKALAKKFCLAMFFYAAIVISSYLSEIYADAFASSQMAHPRTCLIAMKGIQNLDAPLSLKSFFNVHPPNIERRRVCSGTGDEGVR